MWLSQVSASDGFTPSAIILALAGVVSTLGALLLRGWQERVKRAEEAERKATEALLASKTEGERQWRERAQYLEDQRAQLTRRLLEVKVSRRDLSDPPSAPPRSDSPSPGRYSTQISTRTKTPRS